MRFNDFPFPELTLVEAEKIIAAEAPIIQNAQDDIIIHFYCISFFIKRNSLIRITCRLNLITFDLCLLFGVELGIPVVILYYLAFRL